MEVCVISLEQSIENINLGPLTIQTIIRGTGDHVILLPGAGGSGKVFDAFTPLLAKADFKTICINPRGTEGSTGSLENLTLHDFAADVVGVIKALNMPPVHVVGAAFGNRVARCIAADHPPLVRSVVLIAAGGYAQPDPEARHALQKLISQPDLSMKERIEANQVSVFSPATNIDVVTAYSQKRKIWASVVEAQRKAILATPAEEWVLIPSYEGPVLVIQGLDDRIAPPANGRHLQQELGEQVTLVDLPNAGHALFVEQPEKVANIMISFLKTH